MRTFVTGGSGFVGSNLIRALVRRGDAVVALARSERAEQAVRDAGAETVVRGDLDAAEAMIAGMQGCDVVFHAAAVVGDWGDRDEFHRINVAGTANVIEAARRAGVPRLVHIGTEAVLVGGPPIVRADETWSMPARPVGLYPETKGRAEVLVREANGDGLTTVVVRPRFIWGPGDTSLLPQIIEAVHAGKFMWIGGGDYLTSTCHIDNVIEGTLLAAERGRGGEAYFLTDGEPVQFRMFITRLLATAGVDPGTRSIPRPVARALARGVEGVWGLLRLRSKPPITRVSVSVIGEEVTVDDGKARRELGYQGHVTVEAGLRDLAGAPPTANGAA